MHNILVAAIIKLHNCYCSDNVIPVDNAERDSRQDSLKPQFLVEILFLFASLIVGLAEDGAELHTHTKFWQATSQKVKQALGLHPVCCMFNKDLQSFNDLMPIENCYE